MTYIGGQQYLLSYKVVHLHFAQHWHGRPHRLLFYKQVFSERKTYGIELYMEHFPFFAIVAHGCVWKHDMEMFF